VDRAESLARSCAQANIPLLTFSSDQVFSGDKDNAYTERDETAAVNAYGGCMTKAEAKVRNAHPAALVIRPGQLLAAFAEDDTLLQQLRQIANGEPVEVANDIHLSVSFLPELVNIALDLLIDGERGIWHIANSGITTPADLLLRATEILQLDPSLVRPVPNWSLRRPAARPRMCALGSERGQFLSSLEDALLRYCRDLPPLAIELEPAVGAQ
jgi:dTDP-4-dehydrorhamnose reductase